MPRPPQITPVKRDEFIRKLIYANPAAGKTSYIGSGAAQYRTLIIHPPLDHMPARVLTTPADEWVVSTWEDMEEVKQWYRMEGGEYDWVWLDSISGWQDAGLDDIWEATRLLFPHRDTKTIKGGLDRGEYGRNMEQIGQWVRAMVGANVSHFGITAWPFLTDNPFNESAAEYQMWPWIQGKGMPQRIAGYMNFIGYLDVIEPKEGAPFRRMYTQYTNRYYAKDQFDAFPKGHVDNPTLPTVVDAIMAAQKNKRAPEPAVRRGRGAAKPQAAARGRGRS